MRLTAKDSRSHTRRLRPAYLRRKYSLVGGGHNLAVCSPQRPTGYTNAFGGKLALLQPWPWKSHSDPPSIPKKSVLLKNLGFSISSV